MIKASRHGKPAICFVLFAMASAVAFADTPSDNAGSDQQRADAVVAPAPAPSSDPLDLQVDRAIALTSKRQLTAGVHTPWQIMHGILALRRDFLLRKSTDSSEMTSAIDWMVSGAHHDGLPLFEKTQFGGRTHPFTKPYAFEGHPNQFFAIFVMSDLPTDFRFKTDQGDVSIADMIKNAKMQVREGTELTWTLWALSHYLDPDARWFNSIGQPWSIERMVRMQVYKPVLSATCGGTHGLFALSYARNKYLALGRSPRGVWFEADQKIKRFIEEARILQNGDGSFSTAGFRGRGYSNQFKKRLTHSGHMLEWLMMALPQSRLKERWVRDGVRSVAGDLIENRQALAECGPLYHAVHALILYRLRTRPEQFGPANPSLINVARKSDDNPELEQERHGVKPIAAEAQKPEQRPPVAKVAKRETIAGQNEHNGSTGTKQKPPPTGSTASTAIVAPEAR